MTAEITTKAVYLHELRRKLNGLPETEIIAACAYYDEYLSDAGSENEATAIKELGTPAEVAAGIIGDYAFKDATSEGKSTRSGFNTLWLVVLGILASPIALPIAIALIAVLFSLLVVAFSLVIAFFASAGAMIVAGVFYLGIGFYTLFFHAATGLLTLGVGLITAALGGALMLIMLWLTRALVNGIAKLGALILRKWNTRKAVAA